MVSAKNQDHNLATELARVADRSINLLSDDISYHSKNLCFGFHLRHILDIETPTVRVKASKQKLAKRILDHNNRLGLHTLNHVIDSLLYVSQTRSEDKFAIVSINYNKCSGSTHAFDVCPDHPKPYDHIIKMECSWPRSWSLRENCSFDTDIEPFIYSQASDQEPGLGSSPYDGFICGAHKLCDALDIKSPNPLIYRSIISSVLQLAEYTVEFGLFTRTYLLRNFTPFGIAVGTTVISDNELSAAEDEVVHRMLKTTLENSQIAVERHFSKLKYPVKSIYSEIAQQVFSENATKPSLIESIDRKRGPHNPMNIGIRKSVQAQIAQFLHFCMSFCEEELEGRRLRFGILLGHPSLLKFWPGSSPVNLNNIPDDQLAKQIHLAEGPQDRLIVIPYRSSFDDPAGCHRYAVDLSDFSEALESDRYATIWESDLRPYVYLTLRYPWALAAIVGPHSNVRVFASGKLSHYRDGKGWKRCAIEEILDAINERHAFANDFNHGQFDDRENIEYMLSLRLLLEFSLQLSPIAKSTSHGALVLWIPQAISGDKLPSDLDKCVGYLHNAKPHDQFSNPWLTGRSLFRNYAAAGEPEFDIPTVKLAIRAAMLDGALLLSGYQAKVHGFGLQLRFPDVVESASGTKRAAAAAAVSSLHEEFKGVLALAISSDGPIRIYCHDYRPGGKPFDELIMFENMDLPFQGLS